ncbi:prepilin-type N-terminal cleavage/methylation domain-containing protein [Singulisphaera rosea]
MTRHSSQPGRPAGFTLVELLIVMVIIGIILAFILQAASGGIRSAEIRATQSLIIKLENAMTDRMDAITSQRQIPNPFHASLGQISLNAVAGAGTSVAIAGNQRAQVIAQFDFLAAQLPDSFGVEITSLASPSGVYPLNFGRRIYGGVGAGYPLGAGQGTVYRAQLPGTTYVGNDSHGKPYWQILPAGWNGAAFEAAAAIYKNLGYGPQGFDGTDNDHDTQGYIDDLAEGLIGLSADQQATILTRLKAHKHNTARAEMLYALLVEGAGPFGSAFQAEDFTAKEVQDTDGDGLPEFVDSWGQPLQFFRWPVFYHSDLQEGFTMGTSGNGPYDSVFQTREQNPIDPNQQLMAPAWFLAHTATGGVNWGVSSGPGAQGTLSSSGALFEALFVPLREPLATYGGATVDTVHWWNRSGTTTAAFTQRRAFKSKFLILSAGPDQIPGVGMCEVDYGNLSSGVVNQNGHDPTSALVDSTAPAAIQIEGFAAQCGIYEMVHPTGTPVNPLTRPTAAFLQESGADDITNHNVMAAGGVIQ